MGLIRFLHLHIDLVWSCFFTQPDIKTRIAKTKSIRRFHESSGMHRSQVRWRKLLKKKGWEARRLGGIKKKKKRRHLNNSEHLALRNSKKKKLVLGCGACLLAVWLMMRWVSLSWLAGISSSLSSSPSSSSSSSTLPYLGPQGGMKGFLWRGGGVEAKNLHLDFTYYTSLLGAIQDRMDGWMGE